MSTLRSAVALLALAACNNADLGVGNTAPTVAIESPDPDGEVLFEGIATPFRGRAVDVETQPQDLLASWWIGEDVICPAAELDSTGESSCDVTLPGGVSDVRLEVADGEGLAGTAVETFWARPSSAPVAEITSPDAAEPYFSDQPIAFEGIVEDIEDSADQLVVWWESSVEGPLEAIDSNVHPSGRVSGIGYLTEGEHEISLYVQDRAGGVSFETVQVRVAPRDLPPPAR